MSIIEIIFFSQKKNDSVLKKSIVFIWMFQTLRANRVWNIPSKTNKNPSLSKLVESDKVQKIFSLRFCSVKTDVFVETFHFLIIVNMEVISKTLHCTYKNIFLLQYYSS